MAHNAKSKSILVLTGYGKGEYEFLGPRSKVQPDYVAEDLCGAVDWILADASHEIVKAKTSKKP